jgi:hypothetical protein
MYVFEQIHGQVNEPKLVIVSALFLIWCFILTVAHIMYNSGTTIGLFVWLKSDIHTLTYLGVNQTLSWGGSNET